MVSQVALSVNNVHVRYGDAEVLRGVNVTVDFGETITVIGANGAGKTTLLKTISGLLKPVDGTVMFGTELIQGRPAYKIRQMGLIHVPEGRGILRNLTVHENLLMGAYGEERKEKMKTMESVYGRFQILRERKNQSGGSLSGGEQQLLAIARGLMGKPRCFLLDEPSLGLAPIMVGEIFAILKSLKETGITQLLVEQNARQALEIADRAYVMEVGQIVAEGTTERILSDGNIVEAYLGV